MSDGAARRPHRGRGVRAELGRRGRPPRGLSRDAATRGRDRPATGVGLWRSAGLDVHFPSTAQAPDPLIHNGIRATTTVGGLL